ncbi:MAG: hypothetical protein Q8O88_01485 [bacterium]|nr:hypothetical protein [bacterium]
MTIKPDDKNLEDRCIKDDEALFKVPDSTQKEQICALSMASHPTDTIQYANKHECPFLSSELLKGYKNKEWYYACKCKYEPKS